jgi:hypothetical protein
LWHSTPIFALFNDAHEHAASSEMNVEEVQWLLVGAEDAVMQI